MDHFNQFSYKKLIILIFSVFLFFPKNVNAQENSFVTIINPVRIAPYTKVVSENIETQYETVKSFNFPATWLITYDILNDQKSVNVLKRMDSRQEIGLFLEIGELIARDSGVILNEGYWHDPSVVFLSGYTQEDRLKLIDKYFEKFKEIFGDYPETVGSWWTESYSLSYMKEKYGVNTNLGVTDQFSTDEYRIWGTYWSTPYYPSKTHLGIPAQSEENKLDVVVLQWAARDPYKGYESSLYSTQDFFVLNPPKNFDYFEYLLKTYALKNENEFGQMVVGLESDFSPEVYTLASNFGKELGIVSQYQERGEISVVTAKEFSKWYRDEFPDFSPVQVIKGKDVIWYNSPFYRLMAREKDGKIEVLDFRVYQSEAIEPYYFVPNFDNFLNINIGSVIDNVSNREEKLILDSNLEELNLETEKANIPELDQYLIRDNLSMGYEYEALSLSTLNKFKSKKFIVLFVLLPVIAIIFMRKKTLILIYSITFLVWLILNLETYYVTSDEISALNKLKRMSGERVLVIDDTCLQCMRVNGKTPAVYENKRSYIKKLTGKKIIYSGIINSISRENAKSELSKLGVDYLYLVSVADYKEVLPYSPGDWGVELVFDNANAQIWKVKK